LLLFHPSKILSIKLITQIFSIFEKINIPNQIQSFTKNQIFDTILLKSLYKEAKQMVNGVNRNLEEHLHETTAYVNNIQQIFDNYFTAHILQDETLEFFREVAAIKGQNVNNTLLEMMTGTKKYLQAVNTKIEFKDDLPVDINLYAEKLKNLAVGIESCWDIFSETSQEFFIKLAGDFYSSYQSKFQGWKGLIIRVRLFLPSIKQGENLYKKYRESFLEIPKSVNQSLKLRERKSTTQLHSTAQSLLKLAEHIDHLPKKSLLIPLKYLGSTPEEQIEKNKPAMAWAKARLEEIENKRKERNLLK
jgi:hypothetical protein